MQFLSSRKTALALLAVLGATSMTGVGLRPAKADDVKTAKRVAEIAGAVGLYGLLSGKGKVATIGGLAAAGAYAVYRGKEHQDDLSDNDHRRTKAQRRNDNRYGRNYNDNYNYGNTGYGNYGSGSYGGGYGNSGYGSYANYGDNTYGGSNHNDNCRDNDSRDGYSRDSYNAGNGRGYDYGRHNR